MGGFKAMDSAVQIAVQKVQVGLWGRGMVTQS